MAHDPLPTLPADDGHALTQRHLLALSETIMRTRREATDLRQHQEVGRTCDELQTVVQGTEQATDTILTASEAVDNLARGIAARTPDGPTRADAQAIQAQMQTVFEACNFQDLTGQRISKVVRTIVLVEKRIGEMLRLWSDAGRAPAPAKPAAAGRTGDATLLNGPVLPGDATVSLDAVDALLP